MEKTKKKRDKKDPIYKKVFSSPHMVRSLLEECIADDLHISFDFKTLSRYTATHVSRHFLERHDDIIWRIQYADENTGQKIWCYLYLLIEFQSTVDYWMALRILTYSALLWENIVETDNLGKGDVLPPILPILIYSGAGTWTAPQSITELTCNIQGLLKEYQPRQSYFLLRDSVLENPQGLGALFISVDKTQDIKKFHRILHKMGEELNNPNLADLKNILKEYLYVSQERLQKRFRNKDLIASFDTQEDTEMLAENMYQMIMNAHAEGIDLGRAEGMNLGRAEGMNLGIEKGMDLGIEKGMDLGIEKGMDLGRAEGIRHMLFSLVTARWGLIPQSLQHALQSVTEPKHLEKLSTALIQANSLEDFEQMVTVLEEEKRTVQ